MIFASLSVFINLSKVDIALFLLSVLSWLLKVSRIIKRRTIAKEACENGRVAINDKVAKPSTDVKEGDIIEITFATRKLKAKIVNIAEHVRKEEAKEMYIIIEGEEDKE